MHKIIKNMGSDQNGTVCKQGGYNGDDNSVSTLATAIKLDTAGAFGEKGWLRKRDGSQLSVVNSEEDVKNHSAFSIANTVILWHGKGADSARISTGIDTINTTLTRKGFTVNDSSWGPQVYAVILVGHFDRGNNTKDTMIDTTTGFAYDGMDSNNRFRANDLLSKVGHKISGFAGVGCYTSDSHHHWKSVLSTMGTSWLTNYSYSPWLSSENGDLTNDHSDFDPNGKSPNLATGNSGPRLIDWINGL